jgi:NAD(P)-dependent dehydrogenase (short-subunit alcohol dehydrogenase family)
MSGLPDLGGKMAVVTGGASGIGAVLAVHVDVSDPASVDALAGQVLETFGAVHVVCNNAGIGGRP